MAFMVKDRRRQDEYANYEQQLPDREICYRQANMNSQQGFEMPDRNYGFKFAVCATVLRLSTECRS